MRALLGYVYRDMVRGQRWVAPLVCFAALDAILSAQTGSVLPTYAVTATALLFIGTWLTVVIVNNEDPVQQAITEACARSRSRVRLSKLLFAYLAIAALGVVGMIGPPIASSSRVTPTDLGAGVCAQLITALAAVALGALCSRPVIRRRAWSVLLGVTVCLATVIVPSGPPTRQLLVLYDKTGSFRLGVPLALIALETLVLGAVAIAVSVRVSLRRS
ncbi:MAG: hypothetical protein WAL61_01840 [Acidimicrobiales bacterium]